MSVVAAEGAREEREGGVHGGVTCIACTVRGAACLGRARMKARHLCRTSDKTRA